MSSLNISLGLPVTLDTIHMIQLLQKELKLNLNKMFNNKLLCCSIFLLKSYQIIITSIKTNELKNSQLANKT